MRYLYLLFLAITISGCQYITAPKANIAFAENPVIAHRGAWKKKRLPKNSIASLQEAIRLKCTGSEFDIRMTSDEVLVVAHDADHNGLIIDSTTYETLSKHKLSNGETLPTLKQYLEAGITDNPSTGLVCEIKPSKIPGRNAMMAKKTVALIKDLNAEQYVLSYISFSYEVLKEIKNVDSNAKTQFLGGTVHPDQLKKDSISGLDYFINTLKSKHEWVESAKNNNLILNAWTVNKPEDMDWLLAKHFDYITTDEPELLFERLDKSATSKGWELVWNDEFSKKGKPDPSKWTYDYGFLSNKEAQYFTDSLKNARVEKGHLIIETHKENIANKDYKSTAYKNKSWLKYIPEIDSANYTSARLKTEGMASWKYGRIEVRAKLPKGVGLWPAIWMLGENRKEVGWPESGEIDIMEHVGFNPDSIFGTIHTKAYNHMKGTHKGKKIHIENPYDSYHVFALEWTPEKMDFILDDTVYNQFKNEHKTTAEWPFDQKFHLILNVSVGGMLGGKKGIDNSVFPQHMSIDYVRAYQKNTY